VTEGSRRVVVVVGGTRGIGHAIAAEFTGPDAMVVITSRDSERARSVSAELAERTGQPVAGVRLDISDFTATGQIIWTLAKEYGRLDVAVLNAGIMINSPLGGISAAQVRQTLDVNVGGTIAAIQAAGRVMMRQRRGSVVLLGSITGRDGAAGQVTYAASKAAIAAITCSAAKELGSWGVRVNAVAPGIIDTGLLTDVPVKVITDRLGATPLGRLGTPDDVARVVRFLASEDAAFVTGQIVGVDGGLTL
jgi:3-oxoacyl-[acyl-carrier protein] reductase